MKLQSYKRKEEARLIWIIHTETSLASFIYTIRTWNLTSISCEALQQKSYFNDSKGVII